MKYRWSLFVVALMMLSMLMAKDVRAQSTAAPIVRDSIVTGFTHVSPEVQGQVNKLIAPLIGQPFNEASIEQVLIAIDALGYFMPPTQYHQEPVEGGVRLIFNVVEYPIIKQIAFVGNTKLGNPRTGVTSSQTLASIISMRPGQVYNTAQAFADAQLIEAAYARAGYVLTQVTKITNPDAQTGEVTFYILEPRISAINIEGNKKTRDYVIRRELAFHVGDVYNINTIQQSLQNLERLNIFDGAPEVLPPETGTEPGTLIVTIRVKERRSGLASFGIGHSSGAPGGGFLGFVDLSDTNLFGTGQQLSARVQAGAEGGSQISYTNPWIDRHRTSFNANIYDTETLRQQVDTLQTFTFDEKRQGGNMTFGRPLGQQFDQWGNPLRQNTRVFLTLRDDHVEGVNLPSNIANPTTPEDKLIASELAPADVRSISPSIVNDTSGPFMNPNHGNYARFSAEYAGFGGSNFTKFTGEERHYIIVRKVKTTDEKARVPRDWVYATRGIVGVSTGNPPYSEQFLVGGSDTLRGFQEDRFPGNNMLLWNNELRIPVIDALQVVGFVDIGDAWGGPFANLSGSENFQLRYGYGVGIRVQTPIGALRLDYGLSTQGGNQFYFGIGNTF